MAPLIDCVFLLLVFFLATTMLKKKEKQIPVNMPDMNLSSSPDPTPEIEVVAMGAKGRFYSLGQRQTDIGRVTYSRIDEELPLYLAKLGAEHGTGAPIRLDVPRDTRFARIVELLDLFQEQQFDNVSLRLLDDASAKRLFSF